MKILNWKKFKNLFSEDNKSESEFIIGLDLGNATSAIAYFDMFANQPQIIDISGGYGKPVTPTVMQYIPTTKEWVFGEYAVLNRGIGKEVTISDLISKLGKRQFIEVDGKAISIANVLAIFLKELLKSCRNINPKAEIVGIIVAVPDFFSQEASDELMLAFKIAGYEKEFIDFITDKVCIFQKYFYEKKVKDETVLLLDFGSRSLRGGIYEIKEKGSSIRNLSFLKNDEIGMALIDEEVSKLLEDMYINEQKSSSLRLSSQIKEQLAAFSYQHKDLLFQKGILSKPVKLYFTFAYPPFQKTVSKEIMDSLIKPFYSRTELFIKELFKKNLYDSTKLLRPSSINTIICTGGGFEMLWVRTLIEDYFPTAKILIFKNSKCAIAEGASIAAAHKLKVIDAAEIIIDDKLKLRYDYGIMILQNGREKFNPIVERNSFWWQNTFQSRFIIKQDTNESNEYYLNIFKRDETGDVTDFVKLPLKNLPKRPKGTTCLSLNLNFKSYNHIMATVYDEGFGQLFERTDYAEEFFIDIV